MALVVRIFVVIFGFLAACVAAAMVVTFGVLLPGWTELVDLPAADQGFAVVVGVSAIFLTIYAMLPAMLVIACAEGFRWRSLLFYALAGCALALLSAFGWELPRAAPGNDLGGRGLEIMAAAGIVGGFVYWALAGRNAGVWREAPPHAGAPP